jgi:LDH2 family malate/lactate/ureidoglycolate dehydrogenase
MAYSKHAFNCVKCPQKNGEGGCPAWWETQWTNALNGEQKIIKSCGFEQLPLYITELIKASSRPTAEMEQVRNEIAQGFGALAAAAQRKLMERQ